MENEAVNDKIISDMLEFSLKNKSRSQFLQVLQTVIVEDLEVQHLKGSPVMQKQCPAVFCRKSVLRNLSKFTGKHLCQRLFFNNVAGLRPLVAASSHGA